MRPRSPSIDQKEQNNILVINHFEQKHEKQLNLCKVVLVVVVVVLVCGPQELRRKQACLFAGPHRKAADESGPST